MTIQRSWGGLRAALLETPAGPLHAPASPHHCLALHIGRPVRAICRCDGRTHRRLQSRGDIDLVPAGLPGVWEDDRSASVLVVSVSSALLQSAAAGLGLDAERIELRPQFQLRDPQLQHIGWALEAELRAELPGESLYGESLAMALAARLVQRYRARSDDAARAPEGGLSPRQRRRVAEYIEEHIGERLSLAELAAVAGLGASHFKTLFKRSMGSPVHQYVVRRRVERARRLLEESASPPAEVALRAGFTDQSHMARWMRRLLGVTPTAVLRHPR
jgi:AraC family transcriptional regulator